MSTEENKLIAEFCGAIAIPDMWPQDWFFYDCSKIMNMLPAQEPDVTILCAKDFKYHSSWDWLMPVVEKIESVNTCSYNLVQHAHFCFISDTSMQDNSIIIRATGKSRIDATYSCVVKFILWYNTQNK